MSSHRFSQTGSAKPPGCQTILALPSTCFQLSKIFERRFCSSSPARCKLGQRRRKLLPNPIISCFSFWTRKHAIRIGNTETIRFQSLSLYHSHRHRQWRLLFSHWVSPFFFYLQLFKQAARTCFCVYIHINRVLFFQELSSV